VGVVVKPVGKPDAGKLRGRQLDGSAGVFEQKPEGMRIGVAGVGAGTPLDGQALLRKAAMCGARRIMAGHQ
jgi:hypothetical protein